MATDNWEPRPDDFLDHLLAFDQEAALAMTREALEAGATPVAFFEECITPALEEVGRRFERLEIFLPEMAMAGDIVKHPNAEVIEPEIERRAEAGLSGRVASRGKVLLATVQGDIHDIGKTMVGLMLRVNGFEVTDVGTNVKALDLIERAENDGVDIIGLSSLLTTCLPYMRDVLNYLEAKGIRDRYAVIIGGASPNQRFADDIRADAFATSASAAVTICKEIMTARGGA